MSQSRSPSRSRSQSRKRIYASSISKSSNATSKTKSTTPYSGEFEQKLIDRGIYSKAYRRRDGSKPPKPENMQDIHDMLARSRPSLSPSVLSETVFENFQESNDRATAESKAMADVIPIIAGPKDKHYESSGDVVFNRLEKFDPDISAPKPDIYYGARPAQIHARVRRDLNQYIVPSNRTNLPAVPNFFLEGKSASGKPDVAQRQAMYDGAVGARGILQLQNYGNAAPSYDGNAYTIAATYHPGTGTLQVYATHPRPREDHDGEPEYYMTQMDTYAMTGNIDSFRKGAGAYRNAREWTQKIRDRLIANANDATHQLSAEMRSVSRTQSSSNVSLVSADETSVSETSADELALDDDQIAKRRRRRTILAGSGTSSCDVRAKDERDL